MGKQFSGLKLNFWPKGRLCCNAIGVLLVCLFLTTLSHASFEEPSAADDDLISADGKVDVIYAPDALEPYRERRGPWAFDFGISMEEFHPEDFTAGSDGATYKTMFGEVPIRLAQVAAGIKYNFFLGALNLDAQFGTGKVYDEGSGLKRSLEVSKRGLSLGWTLDSIFAEPYVAPYVSAQVFEMDFEEKGSAVGDKSGTTAPTSGFSLGVLIQLNSIDPTDAARVANSSYGLNNTYLDVFATKYNTSTSETDPDFETSMNIGAGLRLEF